MFYILQKRGVPVRFFYGKRVCCIVAVIFVLFSFIPSATVAADNGFTLKTQVGFLDFKNSAIKRNGIDYCVGLDATRGNNTLQFMYERREVKTFQPPLHEDLILNNFFSKYRYRFRNHLEFNAGYIRMGDNIAPTDDGNIYSFGLGYSGIKQWKFAFTQYLSDYQDFDVQQSDFFISRGFTWHDIQFNTCLFGKMIRLDNFQDNSYSRNARREYLTPGIRLQASYHGFTGFVGALFGKRVFAVMDDGFKVQHHAMEFNKTYMAGLAKKIGGGEIGLKYVYHRATELPPQNENVVVNVVVLDLKYRF